MKIANVILHLLLVFAFSSYGQNNISGDWHGTLNFQNVIKLRLIFHISETNGQLSATIDSPDQDAFGLPTGEITFTNSLLKIKLPDQMAEYIAIVNDDFTKLNGIFTQYGKEIPLEMGRNVEAKEVLNRPQEPIPPFPYFEEEVTFKNPEAGNTLAGTITLPMRGEHFPIVVLLSGSGQQDRNEELCGHKPFLVLADHLTRQGIGVLRYDDRGMGGSTGNFDNANAEDFATDAMAAVNYLKTRPELKFGQIGIIGHSEGGMIAPMIAAQSEDIGFIVLLAGPGVPGDELLAKQIELISRANGESETYINDVTENNRMFFELVKNETDDEKLKKKVRELIQQQYNNAPDEEKARISDFEALFEVESAELLEPWMIYFLRFDPAKFLTKVKCPVLALNGEKDLQVEPKSNLAGIRSALEKGGNKNFVVKELPGLNHLFQTCKTGALSEYRTIEETFSPVALEQVSSWILKIVEQ